MTRPLQLLSEPRWLVAFAVSLAFAGTALGAPVSALYLSDGSTVRHVTSAGVVNSWSVGSDRYAMAVEDTIRLSARNSPSIGAEYTLGGVETGVNYAAPDLNILDGTTDGTYNYATVWGDPDGHVYRFAPDWSGGTIIFSTGNSKDLGIAYDNSNDSLWISSLDGPASSIRNYSLLGSLLSSFSTASIGTSPRGLAFDNADGTLWLSADNSQTGSSLTQISTTGQVLGSVLVGAYSQGLEAVYAPVPSPTNVAGGVGLAIAGLFWFALRRRSAKEADLPTI